MSIFRLVDNTPDAYVTPSRDFQLLCNSFDIVNNAVKFDIDSIVNILDTRLCAEGLLELLQTKLGFFTSKKFDSYQIRTVLIGFKDVVRNKGSLLGVKKAVELYLRAMRLLRKSAIQVVNQSLDNDHVITIRIQDKMVDSSLLTELLNYVLPTGYVLEYVFFRPTATETSVIHGDEVNITNVNFDGNSVVYNNPNDINPAVGTAIVYSKDRALKATNMEGDVINEE